MALPEDLKAKDDPVYGNRMQATWNWMQARLVEAPDASATAGDRRVKSSGKEPTIDFGPNALAALIAADPEGAKGCCSEAALPPVLRPADLDFWSMTNPSPHPDPHLSLYLHGDPRIETDVSIVWRADVTDIAKTHRTLEAMQREAQYLQFAGNLVSRVEVLEYRRGAHLQEMETQLDYLLRDSAHLHDNNAKIMIRGPVVTSLVQQSSKPIVDGPQDLVDT